MRVLVPSCLDMDFGFDPQRALDQLKKFAADAPAQIADGIGRLVRDASPERLEQLMKSPARRAVLDGVFWQMPRQLDAKAAANVKTDDPVEHHRPRRQRRRHVPAGGRQRHGAHQPGDRRA